MSDHAPQENLLVHVEYIRERVDSIDLRLKELNGRTRENEQAVARLNERTDDSRKAGRNWALAGGGIGSAIGAALASLFK